MLTHQRFEILKSSVFRCTVNLSGHHIYATIWLNLNRSTYQCKVYVFILVTVGTK